MSSHQKADEPQSCHIPCPNLFQIAKAGIIAIASRNLLSKIMSVRIFRGRGSLKILEKPDASEIDETHRQMGPGDAQLCEWDSAQNVDEKRSLLPLAVRNDTEPLTGNGMLALPFGEQGDTHVESAPISAFNRTYEGYRVNSSSNEISETLNQSPSDIITAKKTMKVCTDLNEINPCSSSKPSTTTTTLDTIDKIDGDTIENGENPCHDSDKNETTTGEMTITENSIHVLQQAEHSGIRAKSETCTFSEETTHIATSDNNPNESHETKDVQHRTQSANENDLILGSDHVHTESSDLTAGRASKSGSSMCSVVIDGTTAALESAVRGAGAKSCRTMHNVDDEAFRTNENHVVDFVPSDSFAKPDVEQRTDPEKAKRIARRRKILAEKKEARLRKAIEYAARDASKKGIMRSGRFGAKSLGTAPSVVVDTAHLGAATVVFRSRKYADGDDENSQRVRWSKEMAQQARERRQHNQRERLLKLMAACAE